MAAASLAFTSAGTTFSIGAAPATYDVSGFSAVSFTAVGEITDIGTFGRNYKLVTHNPIGTRNTVKRKGSYNNGTISLKMAKAGGGGDAGQAALLLASTSDASYAIKIVLQNGTIAYFTGQVMSGMTNVGNVDTITALDVSIEIDNDIITI